MKYNLAVKPGTTKNNKTGSWRAFKPVTDHKKCIGCAICEQVCPEGIVHPLKEKTKTGKPVYDADLDYCKGCGLCAEECPVKAIKMIRDAD